MMVDIRIMASPKRTDNVNKLLEKLNLPADAVSWDDRLNGGDAMYTARKAWLHPLPDGATHRLVLQDDVEVCDGLTDIVKVIAETHPKRVVSLIHFLQPSNHPNYNNTPYYRLKNMPGCAIMMPVEIIEDCMKWCVESDDEILKPHDDLMISKWCKDHDVMMVGTVPGIVQHPDEDSLFDKTYTWKRTSRLYEEHPVAEWRNKSILLPK